MTARGRALADVPVPFPSAELCVESDSESEAEASSWSESEMTARSFASKKIATSDEEEDEQDVRQTVRQPAGGSKRYATPQVAAVQPLKVKFRVTVRFTT